MGGGGAPTTLLGAGRRTRPIDEPHPGASALDQALTSLAQAVRGLDGRELDTTILDDELQRVRHEQGRLAETYEELLRRRDRMKQTMAEVEADARRLERDLAGARGRVVDIEARVEAITAARDALRRVVDEGRVVRLERWGSERRDALALLGFDLACVGLALAALDRARSP